MKCPVCGTRDRDSRLEFFRTPQGEINEIRICRHCLALFNASLFEQMKAGALNNEDHQIESAVNAYAVPEGQQGVDFVAKNVEGHKFIVDLANRYTQGLESKAYLEIGIGSGYGLLFAARYFRRAYGVDLGLAPFELVSRIYGKPDNVAVFEDLSYINEVVDVVVGWHVLEHLPEPHQFLSSVMKLTRKGGILMFQVPLLRPQHVESVHFIFYNEKSLDALMGRLGVETVDVLYDYENSFLTYVGRRV